MPGFLDELQKLAWSGYGLRRGLGAGAGVGALAGAALGGASGARGGYAGARQQGVGVGASALHGLQGGLKGALTGAGKGALTGATIGGAAGAVRPERVVRAANQLAEREGAMGAASRFGERQLHGFAGGAPQDLERVRGGAWEAKNELGKSVARGDPAGIARNQKWVDSAQRAQDMGLTSIPGFAKSLKRNGIGATFEVGTKDAWNSSNPGMRALMVGAPALQLGSTALTPKGQDGSGRGERVGRALGDLSMLAAPLPLGAGIVAGTALNRAGGFVGRQADKSLASHARQNPALLNAVDAEGAVQNGAGL